MLRAMLAALGDAEHAGGETRSRAAPAPPRAPHESRSGAAPAPPRAPRSLTLHFVSPPAEGRCVVAVRRERAGRSLHTLSARLEQDGQLRALALGAFSPPWPGPAVAEGSPPAAPAPADLDVTDQAPGAPQFLRHLELWPVAGTPGARGEMEVAAWVRTRPPRPVDAVVAGFLADALWPAAWPALERPLPAPTIDLTIHFRRTLPATPTGEPVLGRFTSRLVHEGFFEEDGELWSRDGRLLVQSRQLALLRAERR